MAANIKPLKMCINITIPSVEDSDLSLYEAMCTLAGKLQDTIKEINEILADVIVTVNGKQGPNVELKGSDISVSNTDNQSIDGALSQKYSEENPPPYPVTSVNTKTGKVEIKGDEISVSATDDQSIAGALSQKLAYTGKEFTSWDSVRNQSCGVYRTSGFVPWSTSMSDNGLLYIIGNNLSRVAYIFIRNSVPNTLYFAIGLGTSPSDWFFIDGNPISG